MLLWPGMATLRNALKRLRIHFPVRCVIAVPARQGGVVRVLEQNFEREALHMSVAEQDIRAPVMPLVGLFSSEHIALVEGRVITDST